MKAEYLCRNKLQMTKDNVICQSWISLCYLTLKRVSYSILTYFEGRNAPLLIDHTIILLHDFMPSVCSLEEFPALPENICLS